MSVVGDTKLFWNADRVESGGVEEIHHDNDPRRALFVRLTVIGIGEAFAETYRPDARCIRAAAAATAASSPSSNA